MRNLLAEELAELAAGDRPEVGNRPQHQPFAVRQRLRILGAEAGGDLDRLPKSFLVRRFQSPATATRSQAGRFPVASR
ncbi:hypothetical protein [Bradyrhizobium sp. dw_411]|uniref:hypothetical protein n=1 Tax=Bradyrhizobium sp. dw_411 TaxID=2720082 RepID=UPI001BCA7F3E|nr:hypothetical protein [Bradyrhizobium sp. dw_411]